MERDKQVVITETQQVQVARKVAQSIKFFVDNEIEADGEQLEEWLEALHHVELI